MKKKGFTLIELLIVVAIIGLLATIGMVSMTSARAKARDSKRLSDLSQIRNGMELYFNDNGTYTLKKGVNDCSITQTYKEDGSGCDDTVYIKWKDFVDPRASKIASATECTNASTAACHYSWTVMPNVDGYEVCARMERANDKFPNGSDDGYMISVTPDGFQENCYVAVP